MIFGRSNEKKASFFAEGNPQLGENRACCYSIPLGAILIFAALSIFKSLSVASSLKAFIWLSKVDMVFFGFLLLQLILLARSSNSILRLFLHTLIILSLCTYELQVISLTLFDMNLTLSNVVDFAPEWSWNITFVKPLHVVMLVIAVALYCVLWVKLSARQLWYLTGLALCSSVVGLAPLKKVPDYAKKYVFDIRDITLQKEAQGQTCSDSYSERDIQALGAWESKTEVLDLGAFAGRNIVLAVIESMSAVDSRRTSGLQNLFPRFDRISKKGTLFRNVFASYYQTSGGLVGLFNGVAPLSYPIAKVPLLNAFDSLPAVPWAFKENGYKTIFLKNAPLAFENTRSYAPRIGFDFTAGYDEIERYRGKPTFTCGVVGDEYLMEESVEQVSTLMRSPQPFFLALLTTSSHVPWVDPMKRENTPENVFDYVDRQIENLYDGLERAGFFQANGVLLLTADHRKPQPISDRERKKYGDSAKARIPFFMMGSGIQAGAFDDRFLSQADIFKRLGDLLDPSIPLSSYSVYVDHYSRLVWQDQPKSNFVVFTAADQGQTQLSGTVNGACLTWDTPSSALQGSIEHDIHVQRASHQWNFEKKAVRCNLVPSGEVKWDESRNGALMRVYSGSDMTGQLGEPSPRFIKKELLQNFSSISPIEHGISREESVLEFETGVYVPEDGIYWFSVQSDKGGCLNVDERIIIDANEDTEGGDVWGHVLLKRGPHRVIVRTRSVNGSPVKITWAQRPDRNYWTRSREKQWVPVPDRFLFEPIAVK